MHDTSGTACESSESHVLTLGRCSLGIIDDVLILSRLESDMLSITPVPAQPRSVIEHTIRMFDGEAAMAQTTVELMEDPSYRKLDVDFVLCDTSRLMQVLINLISNALKFTAKQSTRKIRLLYGAHWKRPPPVQTIYGHLEWYREKDAQPDTTKSKFEGNRDAPLYLWFCVEDTGPGVRETEKDLLFQRFSQASKKTHITYGGSGLGLYICRELVQRQGGKIGMTSRHGEGSAFAFYVETRQLENPDLCNQLEHWVSKVGGMLSLWCLTKLALAQVPSLRTDTDEKAYVVREIR